VIGLLYERTMEKQAVAEEARMKRPAGKGVSSLITFQHAHRVVEVSTDREASSIPWRVDLQAVLPMRNLAGPVDNEDLSRTLR
jgi:hypothetical protein